MPIASDAPIAAEFVDALLRWFEQAMRPLPWRDDYHPYRVWISEIMLQQTQMERGVRYYLDWMRRFPDIASVATADEETILSAWEGLGYYSRALNLRAAARQIVENHAGVFPNTHAGILALKGVGDYTAGAIASIAFNLPVPAVDANVLRVFARLGDIDRPIRSAGVKQAITALIAQTLPRTAPRLFNQALMEFGALVCGKIPDCRRCPMTAFCLALKNNVVRERPLPKTKTARNRFDMAAAVIRRDGRILIQKRPTGGLWSGLWEFPGAVVEPGEQPEEVLARAVPAATGLRVRVESEIGVVSHSYTTNTVKLRGFLCSTTGLEENAPPLRGEKRWVEPDEIGNFAFAAGQRKLLELLGWK